MKRPRDPGTGIGESDVSRDKPPSKVAANIARVSASSAEVEIPIISFLQTPSAVTAVGVRDGTPSSEDVQILDGASNEGRGGPSKCSNPACQAELPATGCACAMCRSRRGFCNLCMCLVCFRFDSDANTCRWIGCDFCRHWCHTNCAIQEKQVTTLRGSHAPSQDSENVSELRYHCRACNHISGLFDFVKDVFKACSSGWDASATMRELECVTNLFDRSHDDKGMQLAAALRSLLDRLKAKADFDSIKEELTRLIEDAHLTTQPKPPAPPLIVTAEMSDVLSQNLRTLLPRISPAASAEQPLPDVQIVPKPFIVLQPPHHTSAESVSNPPSVLPLPEAALFRFTDQIRHRVDGAPPTNSAIAQPSAGFGSERGGLESDLSEGPQAASGRVTHTGSNPSPSNPIPNPNPILGGSGTSGAGGSPSRLLGGTGVTGVQLVLGTAPSGKSMAQGIGRGGLREIEVVWGAGKRRGGPKGRTGSSGPGVSGVSGAQLREVLCEGLGLLAAGGGGGTPAVFESPVAVGGGGRSGAQKAVFGKQTLQNFVTALVQQSDDESGGRGRGKGAQSVPSSGTLDGEGVRPGNGSNGSGKGTRGALSLGLEAGQACLNLGFIDLRAARHTLAQLDEELERKRRQAIWLQLERQNQKAEMKELNAGIDSKLSEAAALETRAAEVRREAEACRQRILVKEEKLEDKFAVEYLALRLDESEAAKRKLLEAIKAAEKAKQQFNDGAFTI